MTDALGKRLADALVRELEPRAARLRELTGRPATLAVVAPDAVPHTRFVAIKQDAFRSAGLELRASWIATGAATADVLEQVHELNADPTVAGIFLQFPLPSGIDGPRAADIIDPDKDVDAVGSSNLGRLLSGTQLYLPATAAAVVKLLEESLGELRGRSLVVVGGAGVAERCVTLLALARGATACILEPGSAELSDAAAGADAIVITDEAPPGESLQHVRNGAVLLDAAYYRPPRARGWLPPRALEHLGTHLPQYGNVGPLTVALLMQSTLRAALLLEG